MTEVIFYLMDGRRMSIRIVSYLEKLQQVNGTHRQHKKLVLAHITTNNPITDDVEIRRGVRQDAPFYLTSILRLSLIKHSIPYSGRIKLQRLLWQKYLLSFQGHEIYLTFLNTLYGMIIYNFSPIPTWETE